MDKLMQVFTYNGAQVRMAPLNGEPAFVAKDVCDILGYLWCGTKTIEHVPAEWRGVGSVPTPSGDQEMALLSEQGLYFFLARSDKPKALPFQKWVSGDVVPSIRKTGQYGAKALPQTYAEALRELADTVEQKALLEAKIEADAPAVEFYDKVGDAKGLHTMNEVAKLLGWGEILLFAHLRGMRILCEQPHNVPRQCYITAGYFVVKETTYTKSGKQHVHSTTFVTAKGLQWLQKVVPPYEPNKKCHRSGKDKPEGHWPTAIAGARS